MQVSGAIRLVAHQGQHPWSLETWHSPEMDDLDGEFAVSVSHGPGAGPDSTFVGLALLGVGIPRRGLGAGALVVVCASFPDFLAAEGLEKACLCQ